MLSIATGFALLATGVILLIPLPEVALPALAVGLGLLGRRYAWAQAANHRLDEAVRSGRRSWARLPRPVRFAVLAVLAAGVLLLIYALAA